MTSSPDFIDVKTLHDLMTNTGGVQVLDVRPFPEFAAQHIPGSKQIAMPDLERRAGEIDKSRPAYLICKKGIMACRAQALLRATGVENAVVLSEGLDKWVREGFPVEGELSKGWLPKLTSKLPWNRAPKP